METQEIGAVGEICTSSMVESDDAQDVPQIPEIKDLETTFPTLLPVVDILQPFMSYKAEVQPQSFDNSEEHHKLVSENFASDVLLESLPLIPGVLEVATRKEESVKKAPLLTIEVRAIVFFYKITSYLQLTLFID
jgi:hypothetical protein